MATRTVEYISVLDRIIFPSIAIRQRATNSGQGCISNEFVLKLTQGKNATTRNSQRNGVARRVNSRCEKLLSERDA